MIFSFRKELYKCKTIDLLVQLLVKQYLQLFQGISFLKSYYILQDEFVLRARPSCSFAGRLF